jgi:hypothetical protein
MAPQSVRSAYEGRKLSNIGRLLSRAPPCFVKYVNPVSRKNNCQTFITTLKHVVPTPLSVEKG